MSAGTDTPRTIGVGVVGLGFMGRTHLAAYATADAAGQPTRIVAVCDADASRFTEPNAVAGNIEGLEGAPLLDPSRTACHTDVEAFLAEPELELVSVCTHTDTHVELALRALAANKNVLVEKPVSLDGLEILRLDEAARANERFCMPAMCMRFWPGWDWLRDTIDAQVYGKLERVAFRRLSGRPTWSPFYADPERSGGALFDLHVHDADLVLWMFGAPTRVSSQGDRDHVTTLYDFGPDGPEVLAEGRWDPAPDFPFHMGYEATFQEARAEYVFGRDTPLVVTTAAGTHPIELHAETGYEAEVRHALAACAAGVPPEPTVAEALELASLLQAERRSLESGVPVAFDPTADRR